MCELPSKLRPRALPSPTNCIMMAEFVVVLQFLSTVSFVGALDFDISSYLEVYPDPSHASAAVFCSYKVVVEASSTTLGR